jgi:hypothetical protein
MLEVYCDRAARHGPHFRSHRGQQLERAAPAKAKLTNARMSRMIEAFFQEDLDIG